MENWLSKQSLAFFTTGNVLNKIGALTLLFSAALFFKVAVDNNWIGPSGRIILGLLVGIALMGLGERCQRPGWAQISSGLLGAGEGILFISICVAQHRYHLISAEVALLIDILLTAVIFVQSLRYASQSIAVMGLLGGFLTPILVSTGSGNYVALSVYLLLLNVGVFAIANFRKWPALEWMAFTFTELYLLTWALAIAAIHSWRPATHYSQTLSWFIPFLSLFFLSFIAIPCWRSLLRKEKFILSDIILTIANGIASFGMLYCLLTNTQRPYLGLASAIVSAVYLFLYSKLLSNNQPDQKALNTFLTAGAWYLFMAAPMVCSRQYITIAWSVEAAVIAWYSTKSHLEKFYPHVSAIIVLIVARLVFWDQILNRPKILPEMSYVPLSDLSTFTAVVAALSFYVIQRVTREREAWHRASDKLSVVLVCVAAVAAYREAQRVSGLWIARELPYHLQQTFSFCLAAALVGGVLLLGLRPKESQTKGDTQSIFSLAAAGVLVFAICSLWSVASYSFLQYPYSPSHPSRFAELIDFTHIALVEHFGTLLLFSLLYLGIVTLRRGEYPSFIPNFREVLCVAILGIVLIIVRRELNSLIFLPPLSQYIADSARHSIFEMALSLAYTLTAFVLYLHGFRKNRKRSIQLAYVLFALTGIKVYIFDLASVHQIYRVLSLFIFGGILLASSYFAQKTAAGLREKTESEKS